MASIRKRTWKSSGEEKTAWIADYFDQDRKRHVKTFPTKKEAAAWLVKTQGEVADGVHASENTSITVREAGEIWLEKAKRDLERSTWTQYDTHLRLHIAPRIGGVKLARLSTPMVEAFRDELEGVLSRALARKVLESLKAIISEALRRGSVARNAALPTKVTAKKREKKPLEVGVDIPSKNEIKGILAAAQGRWRPFLTTAIFTGMRASELRGLTWSYVDLVKKTVHVGQRADRWGEMGAPKSNAGYRDIPLQPMALNALKEWRLACPKGELDLVFPNLSGKVEDHENISKRGFQPAQVAAGVVDADGRAKYGLHSLRHFFASYVIEQGFSPKRCQSLLGHSSITMTFDTYGHLFPNLEDDHAKLAEAERKLFA